MRWNFGAKMISKGYVSVGGGAAGRFQEMILSAEVRGRDGQYGRARGFERGRRLKVGGCCSFALLWVGSSGTRVFCPIRSKSGGKIISRVYERLGGGVAGISGK